MPYSGLLKYLKPTHEDKITNNKIKPSYKCDRCYNRTRKLREATYNYIRYSVLPFRVKAASASWSTGGEEGLRRNTGVLSTLSLPSPFSGDGLVMLL